METRSEGVVTLGRDPLPGETTPLSVLPPARLKRVGAESAPRWSSHSGYRIEGDTVVFVFAPERFPNHDWTDDPIRVAGPFNRWNPDDAWRLSETTEHHRTRLVLRIPLPQVAGETPAPVDFKFLAGSGFWFQPPDDAPNRTLDPEGRANLRLDPERSGKHVLSFTLESAPEPGRPITLLWGGARETIAIKAGPGGAFLDLWTPRGLGASVTDDTTTFRLFAPRASGVLLETTSPDGRIHERTGLSPGDDGVWEANRPGNLHGLRYRYFVSGENHDASTAFDATDPVLDPYARACVGPAGPGVVIDERKLPYPEKTYTPPEPAGSRHRGGAPAGPARARSGIRRNSPARFPGARGVHPEAGLPAAHARHQCDRAVAGAGDGCAGPGERPPGFHWGYMR